MSLPELRAFVEQLDRLSAEIAIIRQQAARYMAPPREERSDDDEWCDVATASERLNIPQDTIRKACRKKGIGRRKGGRWLVHSSTAKRYFERK